MSYDSQNRKALDLIERANRISIFTVLEDFFGIRHPASGRSYKGYCPFGFEHPDGGIDKGWRTYPATNSSYCFVMHGFMPPVRLIQIRRDVKATTAARHLLEHYGLLRPRPYHERFKELVAERETRLTNIGQTAYLVEALHTALAAHPSYAEAQFSDRFSGAVESELERLDALLADKGSATEEGVREWFRQAKQELTQLLEDTGWRKPQSQPSPRRRS